MKVHQECVGSTTSTDASEGRLMARDPPAALQREVRHVSSASRTIASANASEEGRLTLKARRAALEQEVANLRKKHIREVIVHKALDRALQRPVGVLPRIPAHLPVKIQKLLAEVAILEEEVIRLEDHVIYLQHGNL